MIGKFGSASLAVVAAVVLAGVSTQAAAQNLVTNGDFETGGAFGTITGFDLNKCEVSAPFGGLFRSGILGVGGSAAAAFTSRNCLSSLSQTLATVIGQRYSVSFSARVNTAAVSNDLLVSFGGNELFNQMLTSNAFQEFTVFGTATSNASVFTVSGRNSGNSNLVDNISIREVGAVSVVPEPATAALMGSGLLALFGVGYLRRRAAAK